MNFVKENAAPGIHQKDGPPRLNPGRCGSNLTPANGLNQSLSGVPSAPRKPGGERMNQEIVLRPHQNHVVGQQEPFDSKQKEILKNSICKGFSNEEFEVFLMACVKTQLDPFMRQIYAVKRKSKLSDGSWGEAMTIQTGIDGYRLIAERTERYAPGPEPTYIYDENGRLISSTSYIKKQTVDGTWHTVSASAHLDEYCQTFRDKQTGEKRPMGMWATMPRTMLAKCAESQALRKAFPAEMSGIYTKEEMQQAEEPKVSLEQASELNALLLECDENYRTWISNFVEKQHKVSSFSDLPPDIFESIKTAMQRRIDQYRAKQRQDPTTEIIVEVAQ
jgi:phage recombination protein Bet